MLFNDPQRGRCAACHRVGLEGPEIGPVLSSIGGKFDRPHLIESLLEPSRQIVEGFRSNVIETNDGRVLTGIVQEESAEHLLLADKDGKLNRLALVEVAHRRASDVSLMPADLVDQLSASEFTDLIAYLETLVGESADQFGSAVRGPVRLPDGFSVRTLVTGLSGAVAMTIAPDGRIFVCEQAGALRVVRDGALLDRPFYSVAAELNWERGLIGVALDPEFPKQPWVYLCYVTATPFPHHVISRVRADGDVAVVGSEQILLEGDDQRHLGGNVPAGHQGGGLHFGPDGMLYIGIGEQTAGEPAQRLDTFQGKLLRMHCDGTIPLDNPFVEQAAGKYRAIWAIGLRNPFTLAFHPTSGMLLINDVGGQFEEINRGRAGANYGWPTVEHGPVGDPQFDGPVAWYRQASICGGAFVPSDSGWPAPWSGCYLFADFVHGWIHAIDPERPSTHLEFASGLRRPVDLRFGPDRSLYVLLRNAWVADDKLAMNTGSLLQLRFQSPKAQP
jgi:putative heme-binding domain-containing protein